MKNKSIQTQSFFKCFNFMVTDQENSAISDALSKVRLHYEKKNV